MRGLDRFRAHFAGQEDRYVLIGGAACELVLGEAGLPFRATKDLDIVLCVEATDTAFGRTFWAFIEAGGYETRQRGDGTNEYFRFIKPKDDSYPFMLELFARKPGGIDLPEGAVVAPVPFDEDVSSLSAILLDDLYFAALLTGRRTVDGVSILDQTRLIPFKAKAFLDLGKRRADGQTVDDRHIRKHRNDVFRLMQMLGPDDVVDLPREIAGHVAAFADAVSADDTFTPRDQGLGSGDRHALVERLRRAFPLVMPEGADQ